MDSNASNFLGVCIIPIFLVIVLVGLSYISDEINKYLDKQTQKQLNEESKVKSLYKAVTDEPLSLFDPKDSEKKKVTPQYDDETINELQEDMNWGIYGG